METTNKSTQDTLQAGYYFPSPLYFIDKPEFLDNAIKVFDENVAAIVKTNPPKELYPVTMTGNLHFDERVKDLAQYIVGTSWNILNTQGYNMEGKATYFHSFWGHEYGKFGDMPEHVHNDTVQIVGFYILEAPENSPKLTLFDPRFGKRLLDMPESDVSKVTDASSALIFEAVPGRIIFSNAWLPHGFTRNGSDKKFKLIHFNVSVMADPNAAQAQTPAQATVI